ncbi:VOC family protein [Ornithinimicrobium sp. F0845]|uniref:VOC family protein n=1 Tax=Ornithinimicrobium sp. F0845 TaxID=2926412 RepID=UPI001FF1DB1D|nr:VOC family protein [Ornithinimicrobium sp. F0845]MCK0110940.1 VOC family protein [Ornithinimicrobium sp. F0845]
MRAQIDHVILAGPDLAELEEYAEAQLGVRAQPGGAHPGLGTRNALIGLGGQCYLELVAPDPDQPDPAGGRPFRVDGLSGPTVTGWALRVTDIAEWVAQARESGTDPGDPRPMSRARPDGTELAWQLTPPDTDLDGTVPFLIDWGSAPHPSTGLPAVKLVSMRARHPDAARLRSALESLRAPRGPIQVRVGDPVRLSVVIATDDGEITLG